MRRTAKGRSLVVEKRAARKTIQMSIRDRARLAAPVADVLKTIGEESKRNGTDTLSSRQIDRIVKMTRTTNSERQSLRSKRNRRS